MKYDLLKQNKLADINKVKLHLMLREDIPTKKLRELVIVFSIGENYPFWKLLHDNFPDIEKNWWQRELAESYYNNRQEWYHQWRLQDFKKDEWLHFYHGWQSEKKEFEDFWKQLKSLPEVKTVNLAEIMRKKNHSSE